MTATSGLSIGARAVRAEARTSGDRSADPNEEVVETGEPAEQPADLEHLDAGQRVGERWQVRQGVGERLVETQRAGEPDRFLGAVGAGTIRASLNRARVRRQLVAIFGDVDLVGPVGVMHGYLVPILREG